MKSLDEIRLRAASVVGRMNSVADASNMASIASAEDWETLERHCRLQTSLMFHQMRRMMAYASVASRKAKNHDPIEVPQKRK